MMLKSPSLFLKLTLLALMAALLSTLFIGIFAHFFLDHSKELFTHGARPLSHVIAHELKSNPSPQRLLELAKQFDVQMRYDDGTEQFVTNKDMPNFKEIKNMKKHKRRWVRGLPRAMRVLEDGNTLYLHSKKRQIRILIKLNDHSQADNTFFGLLAGLIAALLLVWLAVYLLVRWQLRPLEVLRKDMEEIGHGRWHQLNITRNDEIGRLAREFNRMQDRLKNEIEARERFLRDASHELRTPLTRLKLRIEFIENKDLHGKLSHDIDQIEALTNGILQNIRLRTEGEVAIKEKITLTPFLSDLIQVRLPEEQTRISCNCGELVVLGVRDSLTIAFNNLIDNGLKYANNITIQAQSVPAPTKVNGGNANYVQIQINDNGEGIPEKDLPNLFQPFYRADVSRTRNTGGFGLGLAIVAAAIESQAGTINASNHSNGGLQITICLPQEN